MPRRPERYDRDILRYPVPAPWVGYHPITYRGGGMIYGLEGGGWEPFDPWSEPQVHRYEGDYTPGVTPRESPTYGRGGDRAARRWVRRHGLETESVFYPRRRRRHRQRSSGYEPRGRGRWG